MYKGIIKKISSFKIYHLSGFYRKDHLRKHTRSHIARRVKSEMSAQAASTGTTANTPNVQTS